MFYFNQCKTVQEVKSLYRKLAFKFHPDHGGDTETMKIINIQYHESLKNLDGFVSRGSDGKDHTYRYNRDVEQDIINKINQLLILKMTGVDVELIGTWVWIHGETKQYKEELKKLGCHWHSKRQMWYWHKRTAYRRKYSGAPFDQLRLMYGSQFYDQRTDDSLAIA